MDLLAEYEKRTAWKHEPVPGRFDTSPRLAEKADGQGNLLPFSGTTVVFRLNPEALRIAGLMAGLLHGNLDPEALAEPLPADSFHLTLHDLVSAPGAHGGAAFRAEADRSLRAALAAAEALRGDSPGVRITLIADRIVPMVSSSVVLLLRPASWEDWLLLEGMYRRFDPAVPLPYPLVPHITLAYFRPGAVDGGRLGAVLDAMQVNPANAPVFEFYTEALTVQRFSSMKRYTDIPRRICFCCDGGMHRSVMAAHILNHLAKERSLPLRAEARAAYDNTDGFWIPDVVWDTLAEHGIPAENRNLRAARLSARDTAAFTRYAAITAGAASRFAMLHLPRERTEDITGYLYGVPDPAYETSSEAAFRDLYARISRYLDRAAQDPDLRLTDG